MEHHEQGPRLFLLGLRVHEYQVGFLVLAAATAARALAWIGPGQLLYALVIAGAWLIAKDWRDITPHRRDTGSWSLWFHRPVPLLRTRHRGSWVPQVLGTLVGAAAAINLASALTPSITHRLHALDRVVPNGLVTDAHALSLPASAALLVVSWQLIKRRRSGWAMALVLLVALGALDLLKGLDIEETVITWLLAGGLWFARPAFHVQTPPSSMRSNLVRVPAIAAGAFAAAFASVLLLGHSGASASLRSRAVDAAALLTGMPSGLHFGPRFGWLPFAFAALGLAALMATVVPFLRRHTQSIGVSAAEAATEARAVMRRFGGDTLSFFTLRADHRYLFTPDRRAYLAFQVEGGVLTVAGDPVGDDRAFPALVTELAAITEGRGLRIAVLGAGTERLDLWRQLGLRRVYLGDEAIVATAGFSLEGRAIRKVRQSVTRLQRAGYTVATRSVGDLGPDDLAALDHVSARWRGGKPERGFSMSLDRVGGEVQSDCVVVVASDADGAVRGFLHFAPVYGRPAMSLSLMRADRTAPNGLTEFLVCSAISDLRSAGIEDLSLNFATFGRVLRAPTGPVERLLGRLIRAGDGAFQVSSLLRFNSKFSPRWEPRYLLCETLAGAPRAGLAAAWLEGQVPRLRRARFGGDAHHPAPALVR
jgi:lysyl-tRNA synthetase, class II